MNHGKYEPIISTFKYHGAYLNLALASDLTELKAILHLASYALLNIHTTLISKKQDHQKSASALALSVANLLTNALKTLKEQLDKETNPTRLPAYDKVEAVILRLVKLLTSPSTYGNMLLLFRNRAHEKKYDYGIGKFKFEKELGLVFQVSEPEEAKALGGVPSALDSLLSEFAGSGSL